MCIAEYSREIYQNLADSQSRMIYADRLSYSLTGDRCFIEDMVDRTLRQNPLWMSFCEAMEREAEKNRMMIFGAGIWGNILYQETEKRVLWEAVVDSDPQDKSVGELEVVAFDSFVENYAGETMVLSSYKNGREMYRQIREAGIPDDRIMDAGSVIYELTEKAIYFDLDQCRAQRGQEIFIDAGGFDGLTTAQFMKWCDGKGYSYIFEPDERNQMLIRKNLKHIPNYEIVPKALWSGTARLVLNAKGSFASSVSKSGENQETDLEAVSKEAIESVSVDDFADFICEGRITYIKMDIEGAELEALQGAERVIRECKPKLAVSIYHKKEDIWEIPHLILTYCPDYRFYLRHYSFSEYDTVLYAVPL